ncbi:nucleoside triphosphatase YtkD [Alkalihalophilus lindianensis]|uniref:Nucleoside triphosphatase YtkD n=1 Tax=Alkalihalophilus lindianensis TaxID=1630542 RepID=A0ABU3XEQ1_9BACI|nr:nucleoside triphosphatase YtkD [Alkalihalophilus lindianensis]MDV2686361.1 nucleoside triphosphatase YtkD [Alkalihalophilus lindianensis]
MQQFYDQFGCMVRLALDKTPFSGDPKHVWVICRYKEQWLVTKHKKRGLEFPGGKVERNETPIDAAHREVMEETGGVIGDIRLIGQYEVTTENELIYKNIYFATISSLINKDTYLETDGPMTLEALPAHIKEDKRFSFIMKDEVLVYCLEYMKEKQLI